MSAKYKDDINIDFIKYRSQQYEKYNLKKPKLFTNNVKIALLTSISAFAIAQLTSQMEPIPTFMYATSASSLSYAIASVYVANKEKQKYLK